MDGMPTGNSVSSLCKSSMLVAGRSPNVMITSRPGSTSPSPAPPAPQAPLTGASGTGSGGGISFSTAFVAVLLALLLLASTRWSRLVLAPASWRPVAFVWLLERPG